MEKYDIDEMIKQLEEKRREGEVIAFAFGVGRMMPLERKEKKPMEKAIKYIKGLEGFIGVHPLDLWHTLLIFDTLNNAKSGKNLLKGEGINVGNYVVPILIPKEYKGE